MLQNIDTKKPIILIIPDVHGRLFWRKATMSYPDLPTIFLGDYLDPYTYDELILPSEALVEFKDILKFKQENMERVTLLLGNHDVHYFGAHLDSSRKDWMNQEMIGELFVQNLSLFKLTKLIRVGDKPYLFSHAGLIPGWMEEYFEGVDYNDIEHVSKLLNDKLNDVEIFKEFAVNGLMDIARSRWGRAPFPSIVWADTADHVSASRKHIINIYQIFGHTQKVRGPFIDQDFANLDCRQAFLLMEDGEIVKACY